MKNVTKKYNVGSQWLYFKIYMGTQTTDFFLKDILPSIVKKFEVENYVSEWFFIRYADPNLHLRLRFKVKDLNNLGNLLVIFNSYLENYVEDKLIHNVVIDTYCRELSRYGKNTMEESESFFSINSLQILRILQSIEDDENKRYLLGMLTIDRFLTSFDYSLINKRDLLFNLKSSFGKEFGINKLIRKQLSMKYRNNKKDICDILADENRDYIELTENFDSKYKDIYIKILHQCEDIEDKQELINNLMYSYIHMHCNRLFISKHRKNEWVLYDLLYEYYYSSLARQKMVLI